MWSMSGNQFPYRNEQGRYLYGFPFYITTITEYATQAPLYIQLWSGRYAWNTITPPIF